MTTTDNIRKHLQVLDITDDVSNVTLADVNCAFRRLATVLHIDKAGAESTHAFQELLNSCLFLRKYFKENIKEQTEKSEDDVQKETVNDDDDDKFFEDNFEKFNVPFENKGSFTVFIEDYLADFRISHLW